MDEQSPEEMKTIADIARRYFLEKKSQQEIAEARGIKQPQVSKYLQEAEKRGIVRHIINPYFTPEIVDRLKERFPHLKDVQLTRYGAFRNLLLHDLGLTAAHYLLGRLWHGAKIGVSGGVTLLTAIEKLGELTGLPVNCRVYPLIITMSPIVVAINPAAVALALIRWLPYSSGIVFELPPSLITRRGKAVTSVDAFKDNKAVQELLSEIESLDFYLLGIGFIDYAGLMARKGPKQYMPTIEFNSLIQQHNLMDVLKNYQATGEILYQPFNREGELLIDKEEFEPMRDRILCLPFNILQSRVQEKKVDVIAVAGGELKYDAIRAALHAKVFNILITDAWTVDAVLRAEEASN